MGHARLYIKKDFFQVKRTFFIKYTEAKTVFVRHIFSSPWQLVQNMGVNKYMLPASTKENLLFEWPQQESLRRYYLVATTNKLVAF